jgi:fibronectin type 3 domain-containing protein
MQTKIGKKMLKVIQQILVHHKTSFKENFDLWIENPESPSVIKKINLSNDVMSKEFSFTWFDDLDIALPEINFSVEVCSETGEIILTPLELTTADCEYIDLTLKENSDKFFETIKVCELMADDLINQGWTSI